MKTMKQLLLMSLLIAALVGAMSCGGSKTSSVASDDIVSKINKTLDDAAQAADSVDVNKDSVNQDKASSKEKSNGKVVVIDFFATWCGPCKAMAPAMEKMEKKYANKIEFRKSDVDQNNEMAQKYQIESIPTLVILSPDGDVLDKVVGMRSEENLDNIFSAL